MPMVFILVGFMVFTSVLFIGLYFLFPEWMGVSKPDAAPEHDKTDKNNSDPNTKT